MRPPSQALWAGVGRSWLEVYVLGHRLPLRRTITDGNALALQTLRPQRWSLTAAHAAACGEDFLDRKLAEMIGTAASVKANASEKIVAQIVCRNRSLQSSTDGLCHCLVSFRPFLERKTPRTCSRPSNPRAIESGKAKRCRSPISTRSCRQHCRPVDDLAASLRRSKANVFAALAASRVQAPEAVLPQSA